MLNNFNHKNFEKQNVKMNEKKKEYVNTFLLW